MTKHCPTCTCAAHTKPRATTAKHYIAGTNDGILRCRGCGARQGAGHYAACNRLPYDGLKLPALTAPKPGSAAHAKLAGSIAKQQQEWEGYFSEQRRRRWEGAAMSQAARERDARARAIVAA